MRRFLCGGCFGIAIGLLVAGAFGTIPEMRKRAEWQSIAAEAVFLIAEMDRFYMRRIERIKRSSVCSI